MSDAVVELAPLPPVLASAQAVAREEGLSYAGGVGPPEAWALVQSGQAVLVDVRTAEERTFVGRVPGTEHFRNVDRHTVLTLPHLLSIRIDESLYFANARFLEDYIQARVVPDCGIAHVVLMCSAINDIDLSALESLEAINQRLAEMGISLNLSEVKGPVMDRLKRSHFLEALTGRVYLSQFAAMSDLQAKGRHAA